MRKFLISLMLASVALPVTAMAGEDDDRDARRAARAEQRMERAERPQRAERPERVEQRADRPVAAEAPQQQQQQPTQQQQQQAPREMRQMRTERPDRGGDPQMQDERRQRQFERQQQRGPDRVQRNWNDGNSGQPNGQQGDVVRDPRNRAPRVITTDGLPDDVRQGRPDRAQRIERIQRSERVRPIDRVQERELARRTRMPGLPPAMNRGPRPGSSGGGLIATPVVGGGELRRSSSGAQWATHWRNDRRYDWRGHRNRHRRSFNVGIYFDPFGFGYQRMGYGWRLFPTYYRSSYWLNDPWQYRLPPAYGPYRWIRYWDDALLVDTYSGEVVDVIHDFFW